VPTTTTTITGSSMKKKENSFQLIVRAFDGGQIDGPAFEEKFHLIGGTKHFLSFN